MADYPYSLVKLTDIIRQTLESTGAGRLKPIVVSGFYINNLTLDMCFG